MMNRVNPLVEHWNVNQPVNAKEVDLVDDWDEQRHCDQPKPIVLPVNLTKDMYAVSKAPKHDDFDDRPDWDANEEAAQEIVEVLALEHLLCNGTMYQAMKYYAMNVLVNGTMY